MLAAVIARMRVMAGGSAPGADASFDRSAAPPDIFPRAC